MKWQNRFTWFKDWVGVSEVEFLNARHKYIRQLDNGNLAIYNRESNQIWTAGNFEVQSIGDLLQKLPIEQNDESSKEFQSQIEIVVRRTKEAISHVDVAYLQSRAKPNSMFQVASNFNCAEVPSPFTDMSGGRFVSNNALDHTQGPAASASAGMSLITRIHAPFFDINIDPSEWGQSFEKQIELLGEDSIRDHFPVENGKLIFTGREPLDFESNEEQLQSVRIGIHKDAPVYFGRREGSSMEISDPMPIIDQVFVAALNRRAPLPHSQHLQSKTKFLLRAAYEGTYLAAILRKIEHLVLTFVGGGVFGNPIEEIAKAIAHAHQKWSKHSSLQTVRIPIYSVNAMKGDVNIVSVLSETLQKEGIAKGNITILYEDTSPVDCV